jgi:hypothetical protein
VKSDKELYRRLRELPPDKLWDEEVARFNAATPKERMQQVAVVRAVGVVFAGSGTSAQKSEVRAWLRSLLKDPSEKIRRYAMAAMPKIGAGAAEEGELLSLLKSAPAEREKKSLGRALDKIGAEATLDVVASSRGLLPQTEQKVRASVARREKPSAIRMSANLPSAGRLRIHLRCRRGLEAFVREEVQGLASRHGKFKLLENGLGFVALAPMAPFSLGDLYAARCFAHVGFVLGGVPPLSPRESADALAAVITSPVSREILAAFTDGPVRYRMEFIARGHQRGAVRQIANRAYELCPELLNDAKQAPWSMDIYPFRQGHSVELRPRLYPDPRFGYRLDDVAAASHPPLAAAMARLAGPMSDEVVWDPFCGSGLEIIERALLGGVRKAYGTDTDADAVAIAKANFGAARLGSCQTTFTCCDFREAAKAAGLAPGSVSLVITNPPMGRKIRLPSLRELIGGLFDESAALLKPGGRLVFPNPLRLRPRDRSLAMEYSKPVDLGGFDCRLELYRKQER